MMRAGGECARVGGGDTSRMAIAKSDDDDDWERSYDSDTMLKIRRRKP